MALLPCHSLSPLISPINTNVFHSPLHINSTMKKSILLCFSLLALASLVLSERPQLRERAQLTECTLNRINSRKPDYQFEFEAGRIETWDPNHDEFQCTGVAMQRTTIEPKGLLLPEYSNTPRLFYIVRGRGLTGEVLPGCPETFEDTEGSQQRQSGRRSSRDQHQRVQRFREGDVIALPAGTLHWCYNDGGERVVAISISDTSNSENQLSDIRQFFIAGNPKEVFPQIQSEEERRQHQSSSHSRGQQQQQHQQFGTKNNVFHGLDTRMIAEAFNIDEKLAGRLKNENDQRGNIVRVKDDLQVVRPPSLREEEMEEGRRGEPYMNGLEETFCSMRLKQNIGEPSRADMYNPRVGRIAVVNSHDLPILERVGLSAKKGTLYNNAMLLPHHTMNAHSIIYGIRGRARIQIVDDMGKRVFDGEMREGEVLTVPQNFVVVKRTDENERFEYVVFKTNCNAMESWEGGRNSAVRALPAAVLANAFEVSLQEAQRIKFSNPESHLTSARSEPGRTAAA